MAIYAQYSPNQSELSFNLAQEQKKREDMQRLLSQFSGGGGASASLGGGGSSASLGSEAAARDAAFARAKEQAGSTARASMAALDDSMAERGLTGSSIAASQMGALVGGAANKVNDFFREQAIQDANRASQVADRNFAAQQQMALQQQSAAANQRNALIGLIGNLY